MALKSCPGIGQSIWAQPGSGLKGGFGQSIEWNRKTTWNRQHYLELYVHPRDSCAMFCTSSYGKLLSKKRAGIGERVTCTNKIKYRAGSNKPWILSLGAQESCGTASEVR